MNDLQIEYNYEKKNQYNTHIIKTFSISTCFNVEFLINISYHEPYSIFGYKCPYINIVFLSTIEKTHLQTHEAGVRTNSGVTKTPLHNSFPFTAAM